MISDTLSDGAAAIREYLAHEGTKDCYRDPAIKAEIDQVLAAMDALREKLDAPPPNMEAQELRAKGLRLGAVLAFDDKTFDRHAVADAIGALPGLKWSTVRVFDPRVGDPVWYIP